VVTTPAGHRARLAPTSDVGVTGFGLPAVAGLRVSKLVFRVPSGAV
jgi:hypothetical protein